MTKARTEKLYVNLSASQTRKRLKGRGLGVRRVEAVDRNQSVIFHTATGQHFRDLKALLADVYTSSSQDVLDTPVENLRNLGPKSAAWLREVGVNTRSDLQRLGPVIAYQLVRQRRSGTSLNLLWAITAALSDRDWRDLSADEKQHLRRELEDD